MVRSGNLIEFSSPALSTRGRDSWQWSSQSLTDHSVRTPDTLGFSKESSAAELTDLRLGAGFNVSQAAVYGISSLMDTTFTRDKNENDSRLIYDCEAFIRERTSLPGNGYVMYDDNHYSSEGMKILYHSQDLNATFATFAKSMTNNIRQNSDDNLVMTGKVGTLHAKYQIR